jgi:hypothetical protein
MNRRVVVVNAVGYQAAPCDHSEPVRFEAGDVHVRFPTILNALALLHSV